MRRHWSRKRNAKRGTATVELAVAGITLLLLTLGAADFGRIFYHAVELANAAGTGAFYGAQSNVSSGAFLQMQQAAKSDAADLKGITATAGRYCDCPDGTRVDCTSGSCPNYRAPRIYVSTQVQENFQPLVSYPGIPGSVLVGRKAYMRVQ